MFCPTVTERRVKLTLFGHAVRGRVQKCTQLRRWRRRRSALIVSLTWLKRSSRSATTLRSSPSILSAMTLHSARL